MLSEAFAQFGPALGQSNHNVHFLLQPRLKRLCVVEVSGVDKRVPSRFSLTQTVSIKNDDSNATQGLQLCQREPSERRGQYGEGQVAPLTTPVMWSLTSGNCTLQEDGCLTTANFPEKIEGSPCLVSINPEWTGFLFAEFMDTYLGDFFHVDGERVAASYGQLGVHGMAPRSTLYWAPTSSWTRWKLCQVNVLPPWRVTRGKCYIDREGCFESQNAFGVRCPTAECTVEFADGWEGSLNVVDAHIAAREFSYYYYTIYYSPESHVPAFLTVNGQTHLVSSEEEFFSTGVHVMVASGFSWDTNYYECSRVKICPMESPILSGPWGEDPWTCNTQGDNCELPFVFNGISFSACTQQFSDPFDVDKDGSLHNGHPQCQSATGFSLCGPCSCAAGEEQTYNMSRLYPHTDAGWLISCAPCTAGRFKSLSGNGGNGGNGTSDSCELCPPGASSPSGATACAECLPGMFNEYDILECASCQPGFFGDGVGLTMCQECAVGSYTSTEQQTACDECLEGSFLVARDAGVSAVFARNFPQHVDDHVLAPRCWTFPAKIRSVRVPSVRRGVGPRGAKPAPPGRPCAASRTTSGWKYRVPTA